MKVCSLFHRNKTNNICKTSSTHLLHSPYNRNHRKNLNEICCKMKVCSHFHRNKTNNICKTYAITHFVYLWIELYFGKSNLRYYMTGVMQSNKKLFYKDHVVRCRLRRRRRRSRPPTESI
jgi:hypothetical protein